MSWSLRWRFSVMMFLQYAVWGAWFVPLASYLLAGPEDGGLAFQGGQVGWVYTTTAIAAMVTPFFLGLVADRYFSTERVLAASHILGAVILYFAAQSQTFPAMFSILLVYSLTYMPTLALTNSICFQHMERPDESFPGVRVLGTIGWIVAGLVVSFGFNEVSNEPLLIASVSSLVLGVFCLLLPHTPPSPAEEGDLWPPLKALGMMKDPTFAIFIGVSFVITIVLSFYYQQAHPFLVALEAKHPQALQTTGQFSEMILLPFLPWFVKRLGIRWTLALGMAAWCLRYGIFATQWFWPIILIGLPLHGICYDFFFVVSQIYVDQRSPGDIRASAQGLLAFVTLGVGMFLGNLLAGYTQSFATVDGATNYTLLWIVPFAGSAFAVAAFLIGFREPAEVAAESELKSTAEAPA